VTAVMLVVVVVVRVLDERGWVAPCRQVMVGHGRLVWMLLSVLAKILFQNKLCGMLY
jgi:hypothetical protein